MAHGETSFSSKGRTVKKFESKPLPIDKDYEFKFNNDWEVKQKDGAGNLPYLNGSLELLDTATSDGGKNRRVYHRFFLSLKPGSDGVAMVDRGDGLVAVANAIDTPMEGINMVQKTKGEGEDAEEVTILSPKGVLAWLKENDGQTGRVRLKIETDPNGVKRNKVDNFIAAGGEEAPEAESTDEGDEEEEAPKSKAKPSKGKR